jgi:hypothetical protein
MSKKTNFKIVPPQPLESLIWFFIIGEILGFTYSTKAQLSNKQGISSIGIRPSATLFTFGLPQSSTPLNGSQSSVLSYFPFPFTAFPINSSVNRDGKTSLTGLIGSFDLGINVAKLLQNDRILKAEAGIYYACVPHSYSVAEANQFFLSNRQATIWQNTMSYSGFSGSVTYTSKSRGRRLWGEARNYAQLGISTMRLSESSVSKQDDWVINGTGFKIENTVIKRNSFLLLLEIGKTYWQKADDMRSLDMGIRVGVPIDNFILSKVTGYRNNQITGGNSIFENGAYIGFQMSYNLPIKQLQKSKMKRLKAEKIYCEMERKVAVKHFYKVKTSEINVEISDHENEDGDIVSLCLNGQYILEKYLLTNKPKIITLRLLPNQRNILTVFANNTGKEGANTMSIKFSNAGKIEQIILYSDKKESEGIEFSF